MRLYTLSVFGNKNLAIYDAWEFIGGKFCYISPKGRTDLFGKIEVHESLDNSGPVKDGYFCHGVLKKDRNGPEDRHGVLLVILAEGYVDFPQSFYDLDFFRVGPIRKQDKSLLLAMVRIPKDQEFILTVKNKDGGIRKITFQYDSKKETFDAQDTTLGIKTVSEKNSLLRAIFNTIFPQTKYGLRGGITRG